MRSAAVLTIHERLTWGTPSQIGEDILLTTSGGTLGSHSCISPDKPLEKH